MAEVGLGTVLQQQDVLTQAGQRAGELAAFQPKVGDILKEKALTAFQDNQDIVGPLDVATSEFLTAPQRGRVMFEDIFDPFQREALVSQFKQQELLPQLGLSAITGQRMGTMEDIIRGGTAGFAARTGAAQSQQAIEQERLRNLSGLFQFQQQQQQQASQFQQTLQLQRATLALARAKAETGDSTFDRLKDLLPFARFGEPSAMQEKEADKAKIALGALDSVKSAFEADKSILRDANTFLGRLFSPEARRVNKDLAFISETFGRELTGAAKNPTEEKFFNEFVRSPTEAILGLEGGVEEGFRILEEGFQAAQERGRNPVGDILNQILLEELGIGTTGDLSDVSEQDLQEYLNLRGL